MFGSILRTDLTGGRIKADDGGQFIFRWCDANFSPSDVGHGQRVTFVERASSGMSRAIVVRLSR